MKSDGCSIGENGPFDNRLRINRIFSQGFGFGAV